MKILSSLLLIVGVIVCVQIVHAYGATSVTLRLGGLNINTAGAIIGNFGLDNGTFNVYADVKDCDPANSKSGAFAQQRIVSVAFETGPLHAAGVAQCHVQGHDKWGNPQRDDDSDTN